MRGVGDSFKRNLNKLQNLNIFLYLEEKYFSEHCFKIIDSQR